MSNRPTYEQIKKKLSEVNISDVQTEFDNTYRAMLTARNKLSKDLTNIKLRAEVEELRLTCKNLHILLEYAYNI